MTWKYAVGDTVKIVREKCFIVGPETKFRLGDEGVVKELYEPAGGGGRAYKLQGDQPFWFWFEYELELCVPGESFDGIEELLWNTK